jgi:hypothetical protein
MPTRQELHDFLTPYGNQLESAAGIGEVGHDGIWTREPKPRLVPGSEALVWSYLAGDLSAGDVRDACMARLDDPRLARLIALAEAVRAAPPGDQWVVGDAAAQLRRYYRQTWAFGAGEMPTAQLRKRVGVSVPSSTYLTAEYFPPSVRSPGVRFSVYDAARRLNRSLPADRQLSTAALAELVRSSGSAAKVRKAIAARGTASAPEPPARNPAAGERAVADPADQPGPEAASALTTGTVAKGPDIGVTGP